MDDATRSLKSSRASDQDGKPDTIPTIWTENRPSTGWPPRIDLREFWAYRELVFFLALRDVKLRYKQTIFGVTWAILQPLAAAAIFTVVFGRLVDVPSDGVAYPVFVYAGMIAWAFFSTGVGQAADSLVQHRGLVTNVYFPRLLAPVAAVLPGLVDALVSLSILVVFMVVYDVTPGLALVTLPLWAIALTGAALSVGVWLSALNVLYRDVRYAVGFAIQLLFFASPVIFPSSLFDAPWRYIYALNPMVGVIDGLRWALVAAPAPGSAHLVSLASGALLLATGTLYFQHVERRLGDRI